MTGDRAGSGGSNGLPVEEAEPGRFTEVAEPGLELLLEDPLEEDAVDAG